MGQIKEISETNSNVSQNCNDLMNKESKSEGQRNDLMNKESKSEGQQSTKNASNTVNNSDVNSNKLQSDSENDKQSLLSSESTPNMNQGSPPTPTNDERAK